MDDKLKLMSMDGDYLCPLCLKKGQKNTIVAYQLNMYEAFYNCSNLQCHFPNFSQKYYVPPFQRHYLRMHEPIKYPQVYYGPLPYFEGVVMDEDEVSTDDEEEKCIKNLLPEKNVPLEKIISSEEVDDLLNDILQDFEKTEKKSQQVCPENVFAGAGTNKLTPPNHSVPNYNSNEKLCDPKTFWSSVSSHNASGVFHCVNKGLQNASGKAVSPIKQHLNDREVPKSVGRVFVSPSDIRVSSNNNDVSQTCEISPVTGRSSSLTNYLSSSVSDSHQRMDNAAPHLSETLPEDEHSYCAKQNPLPGAAFAPFQFTHNYTKRKGSKPATRKRRRKRPQN
ncbi:uncharacterized protein [Anabrus simplex]